MFSDLLCAFAILDFRLSILACYTPWLPKSKSQIKNQKLAST